MSVEHTLCSEQWLREHEQALKELFPETWTHVGNISMIALGFKLKAMGIDWRSTKDLAAILAFFETIGLLLRDGYLLKRNPHPIFKEKVNG